MSALMKIMKIGGGMLQLATDSDVPTEGEAEELRPTTSMEALAILAQFADADGDISEYLTDEAIAALTSQVCDQYDRDKNSREAWEKVASKALEDMTKAEFGKKSYPFENASNVHYPLLAYAVMQFNARAYPAIVKGDEAVSVKVVGADNGQPAVIQTPAGPIPAINPQTGQVMQWAREPGAKAKRAERVRDYMNTVLFYRMDDWETETDTLLFQLPAIGCGFRKTWFDGEGHQSRFVTAMHLVVDDGAKSLDDAPQIAEEMHGVFPHHLRRDMATGKYRTVEIDLEQHEARMLLEVQCYHDLDGDGVDEPYIVTIDHKERQLLRVVPDFEASSIKAGKNGKLAFIERRTFYTKYEFLPHPEGKFYNPGLAHLLDQYSSVINTLINQMLDAGHAATAGGGFIASGLRIQGQGQSSTLRFRPGEYKSVSVTGDQLRNGIVDRTLPQVSPVSFNLLDLMLGAAKDIASIKDVLSGDASNQGQVGTTLALIEQGLQVFTAIYKRVYRGLKGEFTLLFANIGKYADDRTVAEYMELLDDPAANFVQDFNAQDMDIRPVSDPSSVTKMQKMARAQFLMGTIDVLSTVGGDPKEALRRVYEAGDVEDIEKLLPPPNPMAGMVQQLEMADRQAGIADKASKAKLNEAKAGEIFGKLQFEGAKLQQDGAIAAGRQQIDEAKVTIDAFQAGMNAGAA